MSRSGYTDDYDYNQWANIRWRGQVTSSIRGKRGQAFLRELRDALDAMPVKMLVSGELMDGDTGCVCAIGALAQHRGMDVEALEKQRKDWADEDDYGEADDPEYANAMLADLFGVASPLIKELQYENDESCWFPYGEKPTFAQKAARRWRVVRAWVENQIKEEADGKTDKQSTQGAAE